jgi:hypothetical protein
VVNNSSVKKILILAANPKNSVPLRLDEEVREIDEGLRIGLSWSRSGRCGQGTCRIKRFIQL